MALTSLTLAVSSPANAGDLRPVDDSYSIAQRYAGYKDTYPELRWPASTFENGQQIRFDQSYKSANGRDLHIDIFSPVPGHNHRQGIVLVHGGAWRSGSKAHFYALANLLAQRGYTVFLPEYRLAPEAGYPAGLIDVNDAIIWVKQHAEAFGIDTETLALGGASSGGQMAALLAFAADTPLFKSQPSDNTGIKALIDLDGVLDFTTPQALKFENAAGRQSPAAKWLGGAMEDVPATWREASPAYHVSPNAPQTLIISSGIARFTAGHEEVEKKLDAYGVRHEFYALANAPHDIWLFEPYLSQVVEKIDFFLQHK